jgi:hypothetical protein
LALLGLAILFGLAQVMLVPVRSQSARVAAAQSSIDDLRRRHAAVVFATARLATAVGERDARLDSDGSVQDGLQRLQESVRTALAAAGGTPVVSQTGSEPVGGELTTLLLLLRAQVSEPGLMAFLKAVESGLPKIAVRSLEVHPDPAGENGRLELTVTLLTLHSDAL